MNPLTLIMFLCAGISYIKCDSVGSDDYSSGRSSIITPTSDIPTTSTWGYDETKKYFDFIRTKPSTGLDHFKTIILNNNVPENLSNLETWNELLTLGSEGKYDGAQWMQYYMIIEALDQGKFGLALGIMNVLLPEDADSDSVSEEIRELMRGNPGGAYEGILTRLIKAQNRYKVGDGNGDVEALRFKFLKAAYFFKQSNFLDAKQKLTNMINSGPVNWKKILDGMRKSVSDYEPTDSDTESIDENVANEILAIYNTGYVYAVIINLDVKDLKGLINDIIAFGNTELVNIAMVKLTSHEPGIVKSLAEGKIWNHVKTGIIAKALRKFDVPIIYGRDYKMARRAVYSIENEKERHAILRQLKFDNSQNSADKIAHDDLFKNDQKLTMREALMLKNPRLVEAMFTRSSLILPDPKWIIFAVKFSDKACLKVLLEERVPLPEEGELAKAYGMAAFSGAEETVESYRAKYRELQSVLDDEDASAPPVIYDGSVGGELWAVTHRADPAAATEPAPESEVRNARSTNNTTTVTTYSNVPVIDETFRFDSEGAFPNLDAVGNAEIEIYFELRQLYLAMSNQGQLA